MKNIAIIPARGGSKRIPRKNIREFCGSPIIKYSIEAAISSKCFDEIIVSTDDEEISQIAKKYGAKVPFLRSKKNSDDYSGTQDVLLEVISKYQELGKNYDYLCCIYPTAPFVTAKKLISAMQALKTNKYYDCVLPVVKYSYPIQRSLKIDDGKLIMNWPENYSKRSQDLESTYHDAGQFYLTKTSNFLENKSLFTKKTLPIIISETEVQDIDNEEDWKIAEIKYRILNEKNII
jgi:N-acylneuraminate cytidylyltransferase